MRASKIELISSVRWKLKARSYALCKLDNSLHAAPNLSLRQMLKGRERSVDILSRNLLTSPN
jgi:hypothetical protein